MPETLKVLHKPYKGDDLATKLRLVIGGEKRRVMRGQTRPSRTWGSCRAPEGATGPPFGDGVIVFEGTIHHRTSNFEH
jgi:hypothetical protein